MRRFLRGWWVCVAAALGCGGRVVLDGAGGSSSASGTGGSGGGSACPLLAPSDGEACTSPGLTCDVGLCCGETVTCSGGAWQVNPGECTKPCAPCGAIPDGCAGVCVEIGSAGPAGIFRCGADPCGTQPLSCACASALCQTGCVEVSSTVNGGEILVCSSASQ